MKEFTVYRLQISALISEIFKLEKCVKYAHEMPDDVIHSTQLYIKYMNRAILVNLQHRLLKHTGNTPTAIKNSVPMATQSFPVPTHLISIC